MSVASTINQITVQTAQVTGAAIAAVQAAQAAGGTNQEKQSTVVKILTGIEAGSGALESHPNPVVASTALLVNLIVSIFKALKHPAFVTPVATPPASVIA